MEINEVISACAFTKPMHVLHLYSSAANKYAVHLPFLANAGRGRGGRAIYVTPENPEEVMKKFSGQNINLTVVGPEKIGKMDTDAKNVIILDSLDVGSHEKNVAESKPCRVMVCAYPLAAMNPKTIQELVKCHDKLILTTEDTTLLSSASLAPGSISEESMEHIVKNDLELIVLALLANEPMHGIEIMKAMHKNFGVLLSAGTIYPLLHKLEKDGLLKMEYGLKTKRYSIFKPEEVKAMLNGRINANAHINRFLMGTSNKAGCIRTGKLEE